MTATPRCSLIIRCLNEVEHIGKLLLGIEQQTVKDCEVIVVDSGSTDGTLEVARKWPVHIETIAPQHDAIVHAAKTLGAKLFAPL